MSRGRGTYLEEYVQQNNLTGSTFGRVSPSRPLPLAYYEMLMEEAAARLEETTSFFDQASSYHPKFEFFIKILTDLCEDLDDSLPALDEMDRANVRELRRKLGTQLTNLVNYREVLLDSECAGEVDGILNLVSSPPEELTGFLEAASEAKAARKRQYEMVVLLEKIAKLGIEEDRIRRERLDLELELGRYLSQVVKWPAGEQNGAEESLAEKIISGAKNTYSFHPSSFIDQTEGESAAASCSTTDRERARIPPVPVKPSAKCVFCHGFHWSHLCLEIASLDERLEFYHARCMCVVCGKSHGESACEGGDRYCKWLQCQARNVHDSALCPNVDYPIRAEIVQSYERRINDLNRLQKRSPIWENWSNSRKHPFKPGSKW